MLNLNKKRQQLRRDVLIVSHKIGACHIGSALSAIDILIDLFYKILKKEDIFIWSKASGVAALYSVLADKGYFPKNKIAYYLKKYPLPNRKVPGVMINGGSCGHGLPIAVGLALADRKRKVYCLMSDGELQEGTTWESLLFKRQHKLNNLKVIVDYNGWQACGRTKNVLEPDWDFLKKCGVKIVKTIKGDGVSFMKDDNKWHYFNLTPELLKKALTEL